MNLLTLNFGIVRAAALAQGRALASTTHGEKNFSPRFAPHADEDLCGVLEGDPDWKSARPSRRNGQPVDRSRERPSRPKGLLGVKVSAIFDGLEEGNRSCSKV